MIEDNGENIMQDLAVPPSRSKLALFGKLKPRFLFPIAVMVLLSGCSSFSKDAKEAREAANALAQALNPPSAQRSADDPAGIVRGPEDFAVKGVADRRVNLDVGGEPLSVVVRVIQLRDKNEFSRLSFASATNKSDAELFPKELVATNEVVLMPGTTQEITDTLRPEARYVGVVGFFRKPDAQLWRMLFDARAVRNEGLIFVAQECFFTPVTPQPESVPGQGVGTTPACAGSIPRTRTGR
jgi:type VI secretion system protein VasD